jgi:hypothetical protein
MASQVETTHGPAELPAPRSFWRRKIWLLPLALIAIAAVYYLGGALYLHQIDDDPDFALDSSVPEGASHAVAIAADLIEREVEQNHWVANDPFFMPGVLLDNMPNFQQGIVAGVSRFTIELTDQIGRTRGSSQVDSDLERAAGLMRYPGTVWIFDFQTSLAPTASSEAQYTRAVRSLRAYNDRLAAGQAVFEPRADNLLATISRISTDIGSASGGLNDRIDSGAWLDFQADDLFYRTKGQLYAYYLLLRELRGDFGSVIDERDLGPAWQQMLDSFARAAGLYPWVVMNGTPDGVLQPNHLAAQGFYLLRARTQLKEIMDILLK